jgi:hypothetical protein
VCVSWQIVEGVWQIVDGVWQIVDWVWQIVDGVWQIVEGVWQTAAQLALAGHPNAFSSKPVAVHMHFNIA